MQYNFYFILYFYSNWTLFHLFSSISILYSFKNLRQVCFQYSFLEVEYINNTYYFFLSQLWRLFTPFLYFGTFSFNFLFNMIFTYRYCRMLEEGSFRGRTADFVFMFLFGCVTTVVSFFIIQLTSLFHHKFQNLRPWLIFDRFVLSLSTYYF